MKIFSTVCLGVWLSACGGGSSAPSEDLAAVASTFEGIQSLVKTSDQSWIVRWDLLDKEGMLYAVFQAPAGEAFDYNNPINTTFKDSYTYSPKNVFAEGSQCFAVRVFNVSGDENIESMCTDNEVFTFAGLHTITRQSDGGYLLEWERVPVEGVIYAIFERQDGAEYNFEQPSYDAIKDNFIKIPVTPRGETYCYVVRYFLDGELPEDDNEEELCSESEAEFVFEGIDNVVMSGDADVTVTWKASTSDFVAGYNIYQESDFKELMLKLDADATSGSITGLVPGRQYSFGVRAVDQYGREDRNIKIRSIVVTP